MLDRPDEVAAVHRAFADAGSEILLAGTFRALPGVSERWQEVASRAVQLARTGTAEVWASVGPAPDDDAAAVLVAHLRHAIDGVVLETFSDPEAAARAVRAVRKVWDGPLVASLVPGPYAPDPALRAQLASGADGAGFNCGLDPEPVLRAVAHTDIEPLWAKPAGADVAALVALARRCRWVGGCCGVDAAMIASARRSRG